MKCARLCPRLPRYLLLAIALCGPVAAQDRPSSPGKGEVYKLDVKKAKRIEAVLTQEDRLLRPVIGFFLQAPRAPELPGQTNVSTNLEPNGVDGNEVSPLRRPIVTAKVTVDQLKDNLLSMRLKAKATMMTRELVVVASRESGPAVAPLNKEARQEALYPSAMFDFQSAEVKRWIKSNGLNRAKSESEIDFARRVFEAICKKYSHGYNLEVTPIWHTDTKSAISIDQWRASLVSTKKEAHSAGLSVLFVSVLRASNIPARILVGQWADDKKAAIGRGKPKYYVKAEFFAENVGWVPADVGSAVQVKAEQGKPGSAAQAKADREKLKYFGKDPGDFLCLHVDGELILEVLNKKVPMPFLTFVAAAPALVGLGLPPPPQSVVRRTEFSWKFREIE